MGFEKKRALIGYFRQEFICPICNGLKEVKYHIAIDETSPDMDVDFADNETKNIRARCPNCGIEMEKVDAEIAQSVQKLNDLGYNVIMSSCGHVNYLEGIVTMCDYKSPYIYFGSMSTDKQKRLVTSLIKIIADLTKSNKEKKKQDESLAHEQNNTEHEIEVMEYYGRRLAVLGKAVISKDDKVILTKDTDLDVALFNMCTISLYLNMPDGYVGVADYGDLMEFTMRPIFCDILTRLSEMLKEEE